MKYVLKRKAACTNDQFIEVWNNIEKYVSYQEAELLVAKAIVDVIRKTKGKRVGYAWSGGKDSLALQFVCERAHIHSCVIGISSAIEYPAFLKWLSVNKPAGLEIWEAGIDINWIKRHPEMLFPRDSQTASRWYPIIQHKAQDWFFKKHNLDIICLGRRTQDGNYVGKGGNNIYEKDGVVRFSPISHWRHEEVMAVVHYFMNRNLPPIYNYPNAWIEGTGVWPSKQTLLPDKAVWKELYDIDPAMVEYAATEIESAKKFLSTKELFK